MRRMQAVLTAEATRKGTGEPPEGGSQRIALWLLFERERLEGDHFTCGAPNNVTSYAGR
jgi:hypothetical protein